MEQRIARLRRSFIVACITVCTILGGIFAWLGWLQGAETVRQTEGMLDGAARMLDDLTAAARSDAFERIAIANRQLQFALRIIGGAAPMKPAAAQELVDSVNYTVGVEAALLRVEGETLVPFVGSVLRRTDGGREHALDATADAAVGAELRRGRSWSGIVQRKDEWWAVSYRMLDAPLADNVLRLATPLSLRDLAHALEDLGQPGAFVLVHDAAGLVRLRSPGAPDAETLDQLQPMLEREGWVRREQALAETELSILTAYRPPVVASAQLRIGAAALLTALLSCLLLAYHAWRRCTRDAIAPLRDIAKLASELQTGRNAHTLAQCGRRDEIGIVAGALVQQTLAHAAATPDPASRLAIAGA